MNMEEKEPEEKAEKRKYEAKDKDIIHPNADGGDADNDKIRMKKPKKEEDGEGVYEAVIKCSPSDVEMGSSEEEDDCDDDDYLEEEKTFDGSSHSESGEDGGSSEEEKKLFGEEAVVKLEREDEDEEEAGYSSGGVEEAGTKRRKRLRLREGEGGGKRVKLLRIRTVETKKVKREKRQKVSREPRKRGRKKQPRRLDGRDDVTSEESAGEEVPVRFGSNYHVLFKRKVLRYASTHSNSATAEKFGIKPKLVREWRKLKEKIEDECKSPQKKRPRSDCYTVEEKLQAIQFSVERSMDEASLLYNVDRRTIEKWKAKKDHLEDRILNGEGNALRETGSGAKPKFLHIEDSLRDWIVGLRLKGITVNTKMILNRAKKLIQEDASGGKDVKTPRSSTWVVGFLKRHNLYHLLGTTLGHEDPNEILAVDLIPGEQDMRSLANKIDEIPENPNKRHRRRITLQDKINIIERISGGETQGMVAKSLSVATSTIQTIWSCRNEIIRRSQNPAVKPMSSTLFWRKYSVIASALQDWCDQCASKETRIDCKALSDKAIQLSETYRLTDFKNDSKEWLKIFCKRRDLKDVLAEVNASQSQSHPVSAKEREFQRERQRESGPHPADTPYTPTSTTANASESGDNDNSSHFHEAEAFNFEDFMNACNNPEERLKPNSHISHHQSPILYHPTALSKQVAPHSQPGLHHGISSVITHGIVAATHPVSLSEAVKSVCSMRSWINANYGPNNVELNNHLSAIENAVLRKRGS